MGKIMSREGAKSNYFEKIPSEEEDRYTDVSTSYKISVYGADFTISVLHEKLINGEIIIPDFQRRYVWDKRRASRLIESFLLNIPVPSIFVFREPKTQKLLVVDGQQRLKTIQFFLDGKFIDDKDFSLKGVQPSLEGKTYKKLSTHDQIRLKDSILRTVIFEQKDIDDNKSMYQIFERLNTETSVLKDQEIRNALYRGKFNELLKKLNREEKWRKLMGRDEPLPRMRDVELILRFLALYYDMEKYSKPMKQFLNNFMKKEQNISPSKKKKYEKLFLKTINLIFQGLGQSAFKHRVGINVALFDALAVGTAKVKPKPEKLLSAKKKLLKKKGFLDSIEKHTTDKDKVLGRINKTMSVLSENES